MNGINTLTPPVPDFLNKEQIELLKRTMLKAFNADDQEVFVQIVLRARLDPWSRQIYATKRTTKQRKADGQPGWDYIPTMIPVTSIQGLTAIADRTGNYEGCEIRWCAKDGKWREEWLEENENPAAAKCTVYRKGRSHPEVGIARWMSFAGQRRNEDTKEWEYTDFWYKYPDYMLGKCAKALALRGAFPDQLSYIYIAEELEGSDSGGQEAMTAEEAKVADAQAREGEATDKLVAHGVKLVDSRGERPSPAEALEEAFDEDKIPRQKFGERLAADYQAPPASTQTQVKPPAPPPPPPEKPPQAAQPAPAPAPAPTQPEPETPDDIDMSPYPEPKVDPPWRTHVIKGVRDKRYKDRLIGSLNAVELNAIEVQWLPKVRAQWDDATDDQKADAVAFEAAIAYSKVAKPW